MSDAFGTYARKIRVQKRVSLKDVANTLGYSTVYISDIERGNRNPPTDDKLELWADIIGADESEFSYQANLRRESVELPLHQSMRDSKNRLALTLARAWKDLTTEEESALKTALAERFKDSTE